MVTFSETSVEIITIENVKHGISQRKFFILSGVFFIIRKLLKSNIRKTLAGTITIKNPELISKMVCQRKTFINNGILYIVEKVLLRVIEC